MSGATLPEVARAALAELEKRERVVVDDAELVGRHSNLVIALPSAGLLVRVSGSTEAFDRVAGAVTVTRWLAERGFPCVVPAGSGPFRVDGHAVSAWQLLDVVSEPRGSGADLGHLLHRLHAQPDPPFPLRVLTDPLAGVASAVQGRSDALDDQDRNWLRQRIKELRRMWHELAPAQPRGLIHGDAHSNNLIRTRDGKLLLADWDHTARGPREWDLIQPYYMARRFNRHTDQELSDFADAYGWDVRTWGGFESLVELREISGLSPYIRKAPTQSWSRQEIAHRVATLRGNDRNAEWHSPKR